MALAAFLFPAEPVRPRAGKPEILPLAQVKPGMKATMWTVFEGSTPEAVPVDIIGVWQGAWGPKQDVILCRLGGRGAITGVAGGMSGSPVYYEGKLLGALSLSIGNFTKEPICGITPIELMLEVNKLDASKPADPKAPGSAQKAFVPAGELPAAAAPQYASAGAQMTYIDTPMQLSGFSTAAVEQFGPIFRQMGVSVAQGGASGNLKSTKPAADWKTSLQPGDAINQVLVAGDMTVSALCTVSYNDGSRILGCGHPVLNLGPVNMPIAKGEVLLVLGSSLNAFKIGNATEVVGALHQDRHSAIAGELGATANMIPVNLKLRSYDEANQMKTEKDLNFEVFVDQRWTPFLMLLTTYNAITGINEFSENLTYRMNGEIKLGGGQALPLSTLIAPGDGSPMPSQLQSASWWGDKFNQLFLNPTEMPKLEGVSLTVDLIPQRRSAQIESAYLPLTEARPGEEVPVKVFLQPYRGERIQRELKLKIPTGLAPGEYRIVLSDAGTLNRLRQANTRERPTGVAQTVSLLKQERQSNRLYLAMIERSPTVYTGDKAMPNLPSSQLNVLQSARLGGTPLASQPETITELASEQFDYVITGSYLLRLTIR